MQLVAADVDRVDEARAARQQHLGEAAGRGAHIEAYPAGRIEQRVGAETVERTRELEGAARHPAMRRLRAQNRVGADSVRWFGHRHVVGRDQAGNDGGLRLGAALEHATLHQQTIDAKPRGHVIAPVTQRHAGRHWNN